MEEALGIKLEDAHNPIRDPTTEEMKTAALVVENPMPMSMPRIVMPDNTPSGTDPITGDAQSTVVLTTPDEFQDDVMNRLGRANGNLFWRKPGVEGMHDGQIMVRLKKKRFIVIDYGIDPEKVNVSLSSITSSRHVMIPPGAGREKCASSDCTKVGTPILLYDSSPEEPLSLYLRSGLCFTCQRQLNEKRRTQRKRKSDDHPAATAAGALLSSTAGGNLHKAMSQAGMPMGCKRYRAHDQTIMTLSPNAIVIEPTLLGGVKLHGPEYGVHEIVTDVQTELKTCLTGHVEQLLHSLTDAKAHQIFPSASPLPQTNAPNHASTANDALIAAAAAIAVGVTPCPNDEAITAAAIAAGAASSTLSSHDEAITAAAIAAGAATNIEAASNNIEPPNTIVNNQDTVYEILSHYEKAMTSIKKCIFLLTQFNTSFAASISPHIANSNAVAAANFGISVNNNTIPSSVSNMSALLIAADSKGTTTAINNNNYAAPVATINVNQENPNFSAIAGADINAMRVADV